MKEKNTATNAMSKQRRPLDWQVAVRRLPTSPNAMPHGCADCGCTAPLRQVQVKDGTQG